MRIAIIALVVVSSTAAEAQYRNYEVQPDGTGGYSGTYGNQNFEVTPDAGAGGNVYNRRPGAFQQQRVIRAPGRNRPGSRNCVVDSNGNAICR